MTYRQVQSGKQAWAFPPPAVVWPDGMVCFGHSATDPPLGVAEPPFEVVELLVPEDGVLVLYTDGLIESANCDTDTGMSRLAELLRIHHAEGLDQAGGAGLGAG